MQATSLEPFLNRSPLRELLALALPTVAQMASYTVMQFIDTWMLAHVGDGVTAPTAAANSGILAFSVISLGMGVLWVVNTLVSQGFGRKDYAECGKFLWQGVWFAIGFAVLLLPTLPLTPRVFSRIGHEPQLVAMEAAYLQIVLSASVFKLVGTAVQQFLLAINRPNAVMFASAIGVAVNALAAWVLIFGHWGVDPHGVVGAAWAQNIGVFVEMLVAIAFALPAPVRRAFNLRDWRPRLPEMRTLLKVGLPSGVQIVCEVLAWWVFTSVVMAAFGTKGMAANHFVIRYMSVSFMPAFGISVAVTALVGRYIGRGEPEVARRRADLGFAVALVYMLVCGTLFLVFRHALIGLFTRDPDVLQTGALLLIFAAVYQVFDAMYIVYNGGLRGAGDTFVPAVVLAVLCWCIVVFAAYFVAHRFHNLGPAGPWLAASTYGLTLGIFMLTRFRRGKWRAIRLDAPGDADRLPGFEMATQN